MARPLSDDEAQALENALNESAGAAEAVADGVGAGRDELRGALRLLNKAQAVIGPGALRQLLALAGYAGSEPAEPSEVAKADDVIAKATRGEALSTEQQWFYRHSIATGRGAGGAAPVSKAEQRESAKAFWAELGEIVKATVAKSGGGKTELEAMTEALIADSTLYERYRALTYSR
jgi:hypothetical protein